MQKNLPIIVAVAVALVIVIVVIVSATGRKEQGVSSQPVAGVVGGTSTPVNPSTPARPVPPAPTREQIRQQRTLQSALKEAQRFFDAENYKGAFEKTKEILANIDGTSQAAKNLKQMAQIRMIEQRRAAAATP